jgi:hypothetical protein
MATWKDKCCFSFIDKQNIGLIPSGGSSVPMCLYYSEYFWDDTDLLNFITDNISISLDLSMNNTQTLGYQFHTQSGIQLAGAFNSYGVQSGVLWVFSESAPPGDWLSYTINGPYEWPMTWNQTECCEEVYSNYKVTFPKTAPLSDLIYQLGIYYSSSHSFGGGYLYNDPIILTILTSCFGQQVNVTIDDTTSPTDVTIFITDVVSCIKPNILNSLGTPYSFIQY